MDQLFVEILIGLSIGFLSGFFGLGGSSIATPLLKLFANVKPVYALATPLLVALPSAISGAVVYYRNNHVDFKLAKLIKISNTISNCDVEKIRIKFFYFLRQKVTD